MLWLDQKYIALQSANLRNFKRVTGSVYNFSCNLCGDSKKNKKKARGYIFKKGNNFRYMCHNCGASYMFHKYLELCNPSLYKEYVFERFRENGGKHEVEKKVDTSVNDSDAYFSLQVKSIEHVAQKISTLPENHTAYLYLKNRQIPFAWFDRLYYSKDLNEVATLFPGRYEETKFGFDPRIVIPIHSRNDELIGITARAINPKHMRYILLRKNEDVPLIFGQERLNISKRVYAFEGPIDSMFMDNSIGVDGSDFQKIWKFLPKNNVTVIFDKQPRNREIVKKIEWAIEDNQQVCLLPEWFPGKDVNAGIMNGVSPDKIKTIIDENTFSGLTAKMKFARWKKIKLYEKPYYKDKVSIA